MVTILSPSRKDHLSPSDMPHKYITVYTMSHAQASFVLDNSLKCKLEGCVYN